MQVYQESQVFKVFQEYKDPQERMEFPAQRVYQESQDNPDLWDHQDYQE